MADVAADQASSGHQLEKRKRGRPRKLKADQPEEPKLKRPRGRPKGSKNKKPSKFREILRPVKHKALLKVQKKTVSKKSQHKWSKRMVETLHTKPTQLQNVQTNSSNKPNRINGRFASWKNNSLKNRKNSVVPRSSSQCKASQRSVISNNSKKRIKLTVSRKVKKSVNSKCEIHNKCDSKKMNSKSVQSPNKNQGQRIQSSSKNSAILKKLQSPVNYRRKSCGLCDQASVRRHNVTSKRFCNNRLSSKYKKSLPTMRRSLRIKTICDKFSNSTICSENSSSASAVHYSSPEVLVPLQKHRNSRIARSPRSSYHPPRSSHPSRSSHKPRSSHHHSIVNKTTRPSSHTTGTTTTTNITTTTTTTAISSTASSSSPSSVSSASTNNLLYPSSLSSQSTPKVFPSECQADSFTSANQSKDVTEAVQIVGSCSHLSPNNCSMKMLKCHRLHHLTAASGDVASTRVLCRHHCSAAKHLNGNCDSMHRNSQPCLPNIRSAVQVAASMISSRITDKSVSIYNHALGKQSGSMCQSYEQLNIVLSPFEKQIFELHQQEHVQRIAMEKERHQMKMDIMQLKKQALERKLKLKN